MNDIIAGQGICIAERSCVPFEHVFWSLENRIVNRRDGNRELDK